MEDQDHIVAAYGASLQLMYRILLESVATAQGNVDEERAATERFRVALASARKSRDLALAVLAEAGDGARR